MAADEVMAMSLIVAGIWFIVDQATKWWILEYVMKPPTVIEITPFFNLVLGRNVGVSFGIMSSLGLPPWSLVLFSLSIVVILLVWLGRTSNAFVLMALGLIVGGALGNVTDRIRYGAVIDFLDFHLLDWHWPAFNLADVGVVGGICLLSLHLLRPSATSIANTE